jgi:chromosome segregation ATPase
MSQDQEPAPEVPQVTMSNTKKELLEAYEQAKEVLSKQAKALLKAEEARARAQAEAARASADIQVQEDPVRRLHDLRTDVGKKLSELAESLEAEVATYAQMKKAAAEKQSELNQLYEIEGAAGDLAALLEAQRARREQFDAEMAFRKDELESAMAGRKAELEAEIVSTKRAWEEERARRKTQEAEEAERTAKARQREQDEYDYGLKREREQRRNALEDELATLEREIISKREAFLVERSAKEAELQRREAAVTAGEEELKQLREKVDAFPAELAEAVEAAVEDTTKRLGAEFRSHKALLEAQFAGERNVLTSRIEALEARVESQKDHIAALEDKLEKAYGKVQDIANRAVDSARREVITVPVRTPNEGSSK